MNLLLSRSVELENKLLDFLALSRMQISDRTRASRIMCSIAFEHAESAKILISHGNLTSATGLVRLQYEALVRAMWLHYAASDNVVSKISADLTKDSASRANNLPMLTEMLEKLQESAPPVAVSMLLEFKEYSWKPLSSFVHGGIHAVHRHSKGYPLALLEQLLRASNLVSVMVGMLLLIQHGGCEQQGKIPKLQRDFEDCLPPPH
jgi:hypothetical protein